MASWLELLGRQYRYPVWSPLHFQINFITYKVVAFKHPPSLWILLEIRDIPQGLRSSRAISLFWPFGWDLVLGPTPTTLPKCWVNFPREYVGLGRSLLSARPSRPTTLTIPPTPPNFNYTQSFVRGHSNIRVMNWKVPDYDFTFCVSLISSFCLASALLGRLFEIKVVLIVYSFIIHRINKNSWIINYWIINY